MKVLIVLFVLLGVPVGYYLASWTWERLNVLGYSFPFIGLIIVVAAIIIVSCGVSFIIVKKCN